MTLLLGLRLALAGGRPAWLRLAVTAAGVGVGVALLLLCLTGQSAVHGRAERSGWTSADVDTAASAPDAALFLAVSDYHRGTPMTRAYAAALGPRPPVPPGLDRLPAPGEVAASPALRQLLASTPDDRLDDRFPGRVTATIGDEGLAHPDALVALVGRTPDELRRVSSNSGSVFTVRGFDSLPSGYVYDLGVRLLLLVGAVLLLVPVAVFVVMTTRIAAAQREQRLAALRLAGATRVQAAVVAAVETGLAAVVGTALGWAGYAVGRHLVAATVTYQGGHFFPDDVAVEPPYLVAVLIGVPALTMLTAVAALSRGQASPLATSRGLRSAPSAWRVLPLAAGIGGQLLVGAVREVRGPAAARELEDLVPLFIVLTLAGFVVVGPWLCLIAGRGIARVSRGVPGLIAARRIAADPHATFRVVSGVVLAAFVVTYAASLVDPARGRLDESAAGALRPGVVEVRIPGATEEQVAPLLGEGTVAVRFHGDGTPEVVTSCADLARVVRVSCPPAGTGAITVRLTRDEVLVDPTAPDSGPVMALYLPTDGTRAGADRARTEAAVVVPNAIIHTQENLIDVEAAYTAGLVRIMSLGWLFVLLVAACSLTVGMVAGVIERRRPFALLRASGVRLGELRRVMLLETAAAMAVTAVAGVALGLGTSYVLARLEGMAWSWPGPGVFAIVGCGVLAALALSAVALPLLDAATRHDAVRYE